jgi:hypothetical protein
MEFQYTTYPGTMKIIIVIQARLLLFIAVDSYREYCFKLYN